MAREWGLDGGREEGRGFGGEIMWFRATESQKRINAL